MSRATTNTISIPGPVEVLNGDQLEMNLFQASEASTTLRLLSHSGTVLNEVGHFQSLTEQHLTNLGLFCRAVMTL